MKWSETSIQRALAFGFFKRRYLAVPNCSWPGSECDMLIVTENLRIIDMEIKISRADLRADAKKIKWVDRLGAPTNGMPWQGQSFDVPRIHPKNVWKHYYCMPQEIWTDELFDALPSPASGVLLIREREGVFRINCLRAAKPNRKAEAIPAADAIDIARLASLRMWDALSRSEQVEEINTRLHAERRVQAENA